MALHYLFIPIKMAVMSTKQNLPVSFKTLVKTIQQELSTGSFRARLAFEYERALTYWNIGKHIHDHLLSQKGRADYGTYLFKNLSEQVNLGKRTLYRAVQFYETYSSIVSIRAQLSWSHFKLLLHIHDNEQRSKIEQKIIDEKLTSLQLRAYLKQKKLVLGTNSTKGVHLQEQRGEPYVYKLKQLSLASELYLDCGFSVYRKLTARQVMQFSADSMIVSKKTGNRYYLKEKRPISSIIFYNYFARVTDIVDGDTLWLDIDLGFELFTRQKVRLRGINTPELGTESGAKARAFVARRLASNPLVLVKTYWRDKFNRYLADVYYHATSSQDLVAKGVFLNQELLDAGLAIKY